MKNIELFYKYFVKFIDDFDIDIYNYCPSFFGLKDWNNLDECACNNSLCEQCWNQETEINNENILSFLKRRYEHNQRQIKYLNKKQNNIGKLIQELCPHKNTITYNENEYASWLDEEENEIITKCKDCGKIINL